MIQGTFVDRSSPELTAHAIQRFIERGRNPPDVPAAIRAAFASSKLLMPLPWWKEKVSSYWISEREALLFVAACQSAKLYIITCLPLSRDASVGNPKAAKALKEYFKSQRKGERNGNDAGLGGQEASAKHRVRSDALVHPAGSTEGGERDEQNEQGV